MDKQKFIEILSSIKTELRSVNKMESGDFNLCLYGCLSDAEHSKLEDLVDDLFDDYTKVTNVVLKLDALVSTLNNFDL